MRVCLFTGCLELYDFIDADGCSHYGLAAVLPCNWVVAIKAHTIFNVYAEVNPAVIGGGGISALATRCGQREYLALTTLET